MRRATFIRASAFCVTAAYSVLGFQAAWAAGPLAIRDTPLFITDNVAPFNMLVVGRDHKLYYEAYNDASDLNGDNVLDVGFKPAIDYYGYFDSGKCYNYNSGSGRFEPNSLATHGKCSGNWSGNWLNYVTTARIDALRKVLYGGRRSTDSGSETVLERTHIPQDAHSWGKEYNGLADGYDIKDYTPLNAPTAGMRHLFANTTPLGSVTQEPLMRVLQNRPERIWEWVSIERPVAGTELIGHPGTLVVPSDYVVRAKVCVAALPESNCKVYPNGNYKPTGLLQDYGENDSMLFGLLSGSYEKNTQGGVLRKKIGTIKNEIDANDGHFLNTDPGIIRTLDGFRTTGFVSGYQYTDASDNCGWITTRPINAGECRMWGNPTGEMLYETLRYFAGKGAPTGAFDISTNGIDSTLNLSRATWDNPYAAGTSCAKPFATVISDINPSYDTDQVPGSAFNSVSGDVSGFNAQTSANTITANEPGVTGRHFIGQSGVLYDGAPTPKDVTSLGNIRGLSPEDPTKEGGYYSASVAYFGLTHDLNPATGNQKMQTFSVALASPLPRIEIPVNGKTVTLVPFAKSVGGCLGVVGTQGLYQPTNQIVDFYVESITPTAGRFRVNFEDVEQGADHDMDAIAFYDYRVNGSQVEVTVTSQYAAGCITQHMGYVISGTSADGIYLEVRDVDTNGAFAAGDNDYFLDTPTNATGGNVAWNDGLPLPLTHTRTFNTGASAAATIIKDPLWYAAKWGGFKDLNNNSIPDSVEWDADNNGTPDNYFLVTNALTLKQQLSNAFDEIIARTGSASSAAVNSGSITDNTRLYQALFSTGDWSGSFVAFPVNGDGSLGTALWDASNLMPTADNRRIFTTDDSQHTVTFRWDQIGSARQALLQPSDTSGQKRLDYLRGDRTKEVRNAGGVFRNRNPSTVLGDIVDSAPVFVGQPPFRYSDSLEAAAYSTFKRTTRAPMLYVGANDGMVHAFSADDGRESWAFIPDPVFKNLIELTKPTYQHRFFVDGSPSMGDAFYSSAWHTVLVGGLNNGGQGIYALDITNPTTNTESEAAARYLWEFTDRNDIDLGLTYSRPVIARMKNGKWAAIFGNGYNNTATDAKVSTTGNAVLYIVDVQTGAVIKKIDTQVGKTADPLALARPNGLASAAVVDVEGDGTADYIYAGDLFGNMWKFDVTSTSTSSWRIPYTNASSKPVPLFVAMDSSNRPQPITSKPSVTGGPRGVGMMVLFGTGKFMELSDRDVNSLKPQAFYGIWDKNSGASTDLVTRANLTQQTIDFEQTVTVAGNPANIRVTSANAAASGARGWYIDLISPGNTFRGEMQVSNSVLRNQRIVFSTLIPNPDPCGFGGTSYLMDMDIYSGARSDFTPFDLNDDGKRTSADMVQVDIGGTTVSVSVTGLESTVGITGTAAIITNAEGTLEHQYQTGTGSNGSNMSEQGKFAPPGALGRQSWRQLR
jgi:type IV pilus assembly protein PilY1